MELRILRLGLCSSQVAPSLCLQTVEKRPREMMLRREFANAVGYLNSILPVESRLEFIHWDFHKFAKRYMHSVLKHVLSLFGRIHTNVRFKTPQCMMQVYPCPAVAANQQMYLQSWEGWPVKA